jgi:lipoprotein-releasing system permease protein
MSFAWMVALRYLRSRNRPFLLRLITWLAVLGVAAGVASLVIALAMNAGFRQTIEQRLLGVTAHVNVKRTGTEGIREYRALTAALAGQPGVRSAVPAIYLTVMLSSAGRARGIVVKGIDPEREARENEALTSIAEGSADFTPDADGVEAVLLGRLVAEELGIAAGDYVTLTSPQGRLTPFGMIPRSRRYRVAGIFDSGFYDYDANWGFATIETAQGLAGVTDIVNVIEVRLDDLYRADAVRDALLAAAGEGFSATTWMEENRALFRALRLEKLVTAIFIGLITFVAGLNVLVILAMTVSEKTRDIAILMAMGARRDQIRSVFLLQGFFVGVAGTAVGLAVGLSVAYFADSLRLIQLDPQVYSVPYVPFHASWTDALWIAAAALAICTLATVYPARAAARILPVDILRFE